MSLFGNLTNDGLEEVEDRLGGFAVFDTDIYSGTVKMAYALQAASGARGIFFEFDLGGGKSYRETVYITNKAGENWYMAKDGNGQATGKKAPLPGFTLVDDICIMTTDNPLALQGHEEKVVKVYDSEQKKELPKSVPVLIDLLGKPISLAIVKSLADKTKKEGDKYVPTGEFRDENHIEKAFHTETKLTVVEAKQGKTAGEFWDKWVEKNKGQMRDKRANKGNGAGGSTGPGRTQSGPPQASNTNTGAAPRKSLFGAKSA